MNIAKTKKILLQVLPKNHLAFYLWGSPGIGKCLEKNTLILKSDGSLVEIKNIKPNDEIISFVNGEYFPAIVKEKINNGIKDLFLITTRSGYEIKTTSNHPFLKVFGDRHIINDYRWTELKDIKIKDKIAISYNNQTFGNEIMDPRDVKLIAYLLGDGHIQDFPCQSATFTNTDLELLNEFKEICNREGWKVSEGHKKMIIDNKIIFKSTDLRVAKDYCNCRKPNPVINLFKKYNVKIANAGEKEIPSIIFRLKKELVSIFLNRLFSTDGSVTFDKNTGRSCISYSSKSKKILLQIKELLTRYGIIGYIRIKNIFGQNYYEMTITNKEAIKIFIKEIGIFGRKNLRLQKGLKRIKELEDKGDQVYSRGLYRNNIFFEEIKKIKKIKSAITYDIEVLTTHNFIANGIIVHNSDCVKQVATEIGANFIDLRLTMLGAQDLIGLPYPNKDHTKTCWLSPDMFPPSDSKNRYLIFFDELANAAPLIRQSAYRLILDRTLGDHYSLPLNTMIVAASNKITDQSGVGKIEKALANRFIHLFIEPELESWKSWALTNNINEKVIGFLTFKPDMLFKDPMVEDLSFCSPRSWTFLSKLLNYGITDEDALSGCIGRGATSEFLSYLEVYSQLPDVDKILKGEKVPVPKEISVLYALSSSLVIKSDKTNIEHVFNYCYKMPKEFEILTIRDIARKDESIFNAYPKKKDWLDDHGKFFEDDNE